MPGTALGEPLPGMLAGERGRTIILEAENPEEKRGERQDSQHTPSAGRGPGDEGPAPLPHGEGPRVVVEVHRRVRGRGTPRLRARCGRGAGRRLLRRARGLGAKTRRRLHGRHRPRGERDAARAGGGPPPHRTVPGSGEIRPRSAPDRRRVDPDRPWIVSGSTADRSWIDQDWP